MKFTAIVPIQSKESSLKHNFSLLNNKPLFSYIFTTLLENSLIDKVICYASNELIKEFLPKDIVFIKRSKNLDQNHIRLEDMLEALAKDIIISDYYILCAITSPFINNQSISKGIESVLSGEYDSAFAVKKLESFVWFKNKALNFNPNKVLRTDEIEPVYIETKGFYIFSRQNLLQRQYLGQKPFWVEVSESEAINIKTKEDLEFAKSIKLKDEQKGSSAYFLLSKTCKHIIFDMDGVLINSLPLMQKAWKYSKGSQYANFSEYEKYIGYPFVQICSKIGVPQDNIANIKKDYFDFSQKHIQELSLYDGVQTSLNKLKERGVKLSIVTSKDYQTAKEVLEYFNIEVHCLLAPDSPFYNGRNKPFSDPLLYACVQTHSGIHESIFVGDMLSDYQAAKNADMDFIHAGYGYGKINFKVNTINKFEELLLLIS